MTVPFKWTNSYITKFRTLYQQTVPLDQIARRIGCPRYSVLSIRKKLALPKRSTTWYHETRTKKEPNNIFIELPRKQTEMWQIINCSEWKGDIFK